MRVSHVRELPVQDRAQAIRSHDHVPQAVIPVDQRARAFGRAVLLEPAIGQLQRGHWAQCLLDSRVELAELDVHRRLPASRSRQSGQPGRLEVDRMNRRERPAELCGQRFARLGELLRALNAARERLPLHTLHQVEGGTKPRGCSA